MNAKNNGGMNVPMPPNVGKPGGVRMLDVLNYHLNVKLQRFVGHELDKENMSKMYGMIRETIHVLFSSSARNVHEDARDWIAQKFYETIKVGSGAIITRDEDSWKHTVQPVYESKTLERVPLTDLVYMAGLFNEATFAPQIMDELKRRNIR